MRYLIGFFLGLFLLFSRISSAEVTYDRGTDLTAGVAGQLESVVRFQLEKQGLQN